LKWISGHLPKESNFETKVSCFLHWVSRPPLQVHCHHPPERMPPSIQHFSSEATWWLNFPTQNLAGKICGSFVNLDHFPLKKFGVENEKRYVKQIHHLLLMVQKLLHLRMVNIPFFTMGFVYIPRWLTL